MKTVNRATIDDLHRVPENAKAELVRGEIVRMSPTGGLPGRASAAIYASLRRHEKAAAGGLAYPDNTGFIVDLPHRKSFSPDAAFHTAATPTMSFVQGAPSFAAEVRSEGDYGPRAEDEIARKRADYFALMERAQLPFTGWTIPVEPLLEPLRELNGYQGVADRLAERAR